MTRTGRSTGVFAAAVCLSLAVLAVTDDARLAGQPSLGWFEGHGDVGTPALAGGASYDPATQTYTITGAGTNMWDDRDEFHVVWRKLTGDFILRTHAAFVGTGVDPHRKMGWIVRSSLESRIGLR